MSLLKCWSVREGGGNRPSKAGGLFGALHSGIMALTGKTNLSLLGGFFSLQGLGTQEGAKHNMQRLAVSSYLLGCNPDN